MHFVLAWEIDAPERRESEIDKQMESCLKNYGWVRPLGNFYIVQVRNSKDYTRIQQCLTRIAEQFPNDDINFIMGPLMKGGRYDGLLPEDTWEHTNEITG